MHHAKSPAYTAERHAFFLTEWTPAANANNREAPYRLVQFDEVALCTCGQTYMRVARFERSWRRATIFN